MERAGGFQVEEGTVMFSDIRGYSTFSEYMDPAAIMSQLNAYFATVQEILDRHDGHFIKSPGDCVVAWFCEERKGPHHSERAIRAAIELVMNAIRFRSKWPRGDGQTFDIGVGINTGPMAVGFLDTARHIEPTLIGDTVNLASRIESLTKEYRAAIIVSEETLAPVRDKFLFEPLGAASVKGRMQPVQIYRIIGLAEEAAAPVPTGWRAALRRRRDHAAKFVFSARKAAPPAVPAAGDEDLTGTPAGESNDAASEKTAAGGVR
jgi:adenylate cyclase